MSQAKQHQSNAERQRAYRERARAKAEASLRPELHEFALTYGLDAAGAAQSIVEQLLEAERRPTAYRADELRSLGARWDGRTSWSLVNTHEGIWHPQLHRETLEQMVDRVIRVIPNWSRGKRPNQ
jgi:hypothetical protein